MKGFERVVRNQQKPRCIAVFSRSNEGLITEAIASTFEHNLKTLQPLSRVSSNLRQVTFFLSHLSFGGRKPYFFSPIHICIPYFEGGGNSLSIFFACILFRIVLPSLSTITSPWTETSKVLGGCRLCGIKVFNRVSQSKSALSLSESIFTVGPTANGKFIEGNSVQSTPIKIKISLLVAPVEP